MGFDKACVCVCVCVWSLCKKDTRQCDKLRAVVCLSVCLSTTPLFCAFVFFKIDPNQAIFLANDERRAGRSGRAVSNKRKSFFFLLCFLSAFAFLFFCLLIHHPFRLHLRLLFFLCFCLFYYFTRQEQREGRDGNGWVAVHIPFVKGRNERGEVSCFVPSPPPFFLHSQFSRSQFVPFPLLPPILPTLISTLFPRRLFKMSITSKLTFHPELYLVQWQGKLYKKGGRDQGGGCWGYSSSWKMEFVGLPSFKRRRTISAGGEASSSRLVLRLPGSLGNIGYG